MKSNVTWRGRDGFTLIEVLVTLILLAILAAAVFPIVTQQASTGDPVRAAQDLATIRNGIMQFQLDERPALPGDIEDLAYRVSTTTDSTVNGGAFSTTQATRWNGPYIDMALKELGAAATTDTAGTTGYGAIVKNRLFCLDATASPLVSGSVHAPGACDATTDFVAIQLTGLTDAQFRDMNKTIDGTEAIAARSGKLRILDSGTIADSLEAGEAVYYLAVPYR